MDDEELDLKGYLPEYLKKYEEMAQIMDTETIELQRLESLLYQSVDNGFVETCEDAGMKRFEAFLRIKPLANDTIEDRRFRVKARWNNRVPYNYVYLDGQLRTLCGKDGYRIVTDFGNQAISVKVELTSKNMVDTVKRMLEEVLPCHIGFKVELIYNQHLTLGRYTYEQLSKYTHDQLRNEVLN